MGPWIQTFPHKPASERAFAAKTQQKYASLTECLAAGLAGYHYQVQYSTVVPDACTLCSGYCGAVPAPLLGRTIRAFRACREPPLLSKNKMYSLANQENQTGEGVEVKQVEGR